MTHTETMTSRQRVLMALNHAASDRVPLDLGGNQTGIHKFAYQALIQHLGWDEPIEIMDAVQQLARPSEAVLERLRVVESMSFSSSTDHEYLSRNLVFPFEAKHTTETGPFSNRTIRVTVIGLGDPDDEPMIDEMAGILCEARHERRVATLPLGELEAKKGKPNGQLVADYCYWFWNNG